MVVCEGLLEQLKRRFDYWEPRMLMVGRAIRIEPIADPWEGAWAFLHADESGEPARLLVHPDLPAALMDWVVVRALAQLMVNGLRREAIAAVDALLPGRGPESAIWRGRINHAEERVVQSICDAVLCREHPFLVDAWFAMLLCEE